MKLSRSITLSEKTTLRPRGSLAVSGRRELLAKRQVPAAFNPDRSVAQGTCVWPNRLRDLVPERLPDEPVAMEYDDEVVWCAGVQHHYGHFLTESASWLWPLLQGGSLEDLPVACIAPPAFRWQQEWLEGFGVKTISTPESGVARFKRAFVPEPAWVLNGWIAPEIRDIHLQARRGMTVPTHPRRRATWLSKSALERERRAYDEILLEWILSDHVSVLHPEKRTLAEQIAAIEASDGVAGIVGSGFHTLLATMDPPDSLFLCRERVLTAYTAQERMLGTNNAFVHGLASVEMHRRRRSKAMGGYRVLVPELLRALGATLIPELCEDPRIAALMTPEKPMACGSESDHLDEIDLAVAGVLLDPYSDRARMRLAEAFAANDLHRCALEQFTIVAELSDEGYFSALLGMARALSRLGMQQEAAAAAKRALALKPNSKEAMTYVPE